MGSTPLQNFAFPAADSAAAQQVTAGSPAFDAGNTIKTIINAENSGLVTAMNTAADNSSKALNYGMYMYRNKTISDIASDLTDKNNSINNGESDTITRQSQINEWQSQNKLDTFFFMQCLFLYLTVTIILLYLQRYSLIPNASFNIILFLITAILLGILWNRAYYTSQKRDKKFWNRRYIGLSDAGIKSTSSTSCATSESFVNNIEENTKTIFNTVRNTPASGNNDNKDSVLFGAYDATGNYTEKFYNPGDFSNINIDIENSLVNGNNSISGYPAEINPTMMNAVVGEDDEDDESMNL